MDNASPSTEQPTPGTPPPSGPRVTRDEIKDLGRLRRSVTDRHVAGVAGGLARHLDVDAIIIRVALVVAVFFGGAGLLLYVAAWILVPEEGTADEPLGLDQRSRTIALAGVGVLALIAALGDWAGAFWFPWPLAIGAALVVWFLHRKEQRTPAPGDGAAPPAYDDQLVPVDTADPMSGYATTYDPAYAPGTGYAPAAPVGFVRPATATAQPAQARPDPVLVHARADRAGRGRPRRGRPGRRRPSRTAPTPPSRSASPR